MQQHQNYNNSNAPDNCPSTRLGNILIAPTLRAVAELVSCRSHLTACLDQGSLHLGADESDGRGVDTSHLHTALAPRHHASQLLSDVAVGVLLVGAAVLQRGGAARLGLVTVDACNIRRQEDDKNDG